MISVDEMVRAALAAAAHLREEADFNRSWTDGRRGREGAFNGGYIARRIEIAEQREEWAEAIEGLTQTLPPATASINDYRSALNGMIDAFNHMLFNVPGERQYDACREAERLLGVAKGGDRG